MSIEISLSADEVMVARLIGAHRYRHAESCGWVNKNVDGADGVEKHIYGVAAELAACSAVNAFPDLQTEPSAVPWYDYKLPCGETVDVKATPSDSGRLIAHIGYGKKTHVADLFLLVTGQIPNFTVVGYVRREELINEKRIGDLGHGPTYIVPQDDPAFIKLV